MKISFYCTCGAACSGTVTPDSKAAKLLAIWKTGHDGEGHRECDARTANAARRKQERDEEREEAR